MKTCFVIQRFDGAAYDRRYAETFAPAIAAGGATPIRADEVAGTRPVVEKIEQGLKSTDVAFAEVSEDNPNVFLELGIALALGVPTVIACDRAKRTKLPFDIAHRPVNFYSTEAASDWEKISAQITKEIGAALLEARIESSFLQSEEEVNKSDVDDVKGACLLELLDQSMRAPTGATLWQLQRELASSSISSRMVALALASLSNDGLVDKYELTDDNGEQYISFAISSDGQRYILRDYSALMRHEKDRASGQRAIDWAKPVISPPSEKYDEDIPF
jgi:DNA-binding PadR family transcriptional regulator